MTIQGGNPDGSVDIAFCPKHGLHGARADCFKCGKPVEQRPMVPVWRAEKAEAVAEASRKAITYPEFLSIGGIDNVVQMRMDRADYEAWVHALTEYRKARGHD